MSTRKDVIPPLPPADALPPSAFDHPILHAIVNAYGCGGKTGTQKAIMSKFSITKGYLDAVLYQYMLRFDT